MAEYLTAAQRAQLVAQLADEAYVSPEQAEQALKQVIGMAEPNGETVNPAQAAQALMQGMMMAQADQGNETQMNPARQGMEKQGGGMQVSPARQGMEKQGGERQLSPEQAAQAWQQGMAMAQSDQAEQEQARILADCGFESVQELADAYGRLGCAVEELREMLMRLTDLEQATRNGEALAGGSSEDGRADELESMRREMVQSARNRLIQKDWQDSASQMQDLERLLPEMADYILRNPKYAQQSDGLMRAYDAVRSAKYRDENSLLADPEFIERMAGDERVREAVLKSHLERILRGERIPQSVGVGAVGGKTPLTGRKNIGGMKQAHARLSAMLGGE